MARFVVFTDDLSREHEADSYTIDEHDALHLWNASREVAAYASNRWASVHVKESEVT